VLYDFSDLPLNRVYSRYEDRRYPLHALTNLCGRSRETAKDYYNNGKLKDVSASYMVWQYTTGGRGCIEKNHNTKSILPGTMMILTVPGEEIYYLPETSDNWEFVFLTMIGRESYRIINSVEKYRGNLISEEEIPKTMKLFHSLIHDLFAQKIANPFNNSSLSYTLCMTLLEEIGYSEMTEELSSFEELLVYLHDNLHQDISIEEMASLLQLSRSHFTRLFTGKTGVSPRKYLEDLRMKAAVSLLQNETLQIKEAAGRVGIGDENYFCRIFRNYYGLSPGVFQNRSYWQRKDLSETVQ